MTGATIVQLPKAPAAADPMPEILVVAQRIHVHRLLCFTLARHGYRPLGAYHPRQALSLFESRQPGAVIVNLTTGGWIADDDDVTLRTLRPLQQAADRQAVPMVVLTALSYCLPKTTHLETDHPAANIYHCQSLASSRLRELLSELGLAPRTAIPATPSVAAWEEF